jgi:hypothetical protein
VRGVAVNAADAKARIAAFMRRAELIMATDAAQREDLATIGTTMTVMFRLDRRVQDIERSHLPETELIAAATMVRPIVMKKELCEVGGVVNSVSFLTQNAPVAVREQVRTVRDTWRKMLAEPRWTLMVAHDGEHTRSSSRRYATSRGTSAGSPQRCGSAIASCSPAASSR